MKKTSTPTVTPTTTTSARPDRPTIDREKPTATVSSPPATCSPCSAPEAPDLYRVAQPWRDFTTLAGKRVQLQPAPKLVRISPNSDCPILNR